MGKIGRISFKITMQAVVAFEDSFAMLLASGTNLWKAVHRLSQAVTYSRMLSVRFICTLAQAQEQCGAARAHLADQQAQVAAAVSQVRGAGGNLDQVAGLALACWAGSML